MGYKKVTIEQSDGDEQERPEEEYIPTRGEAFSMGMLSGWESMIKVLPIVAIIIILVIALMC